MRLVKQQSVFINTLYRSSGEHSDFSVVLDDPSALTCDQDTEIMSISLTDLAFMYGWDVVDEQASRGEGDELFYDNTIYLDQPGYGNLTIFIPSGNWPYGRLVTQILSWPNARNFITRIDYRIQFNRLSFTFPRYTELSIRSRSMRRYMGFLDEQSTYASVNNIIESPRKCAPRAFGFICVHLANLKPAAVNLDNLPRPGPDGQPVLVGLSQTDCVAQVPLGNVAVGDISVVQAQYSNQFEMFIQDKTITRFDVYLSSEDNELLEMLNRANIPLQMRFNIRTYSTQEAEDNTHQHTALMSRNISQLLELTRLQFLDKYTGDRQAGRYTTGVNYSALDTPQ